MGGDIVSCGCGVWLVAPQCGRDPHRRCCPLNPCIHLLLGHELTHASTSSSSDRAADFPLGSVSVDIDERIATLEAGAGITAEGLGSGSVHNALDLDPIRSNSLLSEPGYLLSDNMSATAVPPLSSPFFEGLPVIEFPREDVVIPPRPRLLNRPLRALSQATNGSSTTSTVRTSNRAMSSNHNAAASPRQDIYWASASRRSQAAEEETNVGGEAELARRVLMGPEMEAALFPSHPRHSSSTKIDGPGLEMEDSLEKPGCL